MIFTNPIILIQSVGINTNLNKKRKTERSNFCWFFSTHFIQFGLTKAPIKDTGVINAKYNNTLYGTVSKQIVSTNKLNILTVTLNNISKLYC